MHHRVAPSLLAAVLALTTGFSSLDLTCAAPARAEEGAAQTSVAKMTPLERRRELLRQA